ncbi:hypothetical protein [Endozoicomonas sp. SCSIO W0465]|uniref:hypothetical protein n=1 Tax=Endozoicomonas sp. SCSIO W0465 TaxID=2918516 RepID=UPI0020755185|nr:hypothetical protein [Endozoicomonas sp. SCSIO W0465]USE34467.1 hypothetical protein MJO57_20265 [Endozoicomonas sp. SCSIO W0465]
MSTGVQHELPAGLLLDYREQQTIFRQFPDMKVAAGLVDRDKVLAQKPPIYTVKLSGQPENLKMVKGDADVFARVQRTLTALELAVTTLEYRKDLKKDGVLNIFAMPEFFFRPPEEPRSYPADMYKAISDVLTQTIATKKALKHWLVIPGTIMWTREEPHPAGLDEKVLVDNNTALVINGGIELGGGVKVDKLRPIKTDGMPSYRMSADEKSKPKGIKYDGEWLNQAEYFKRSGMWPNVSEHIIDFRNVRMGMEICADHNTLKAYPFVTKDIVAQLLVSCGKRLIKKYVVTTENGIFMRVDGHHGSGVRWELRVVKGYRNTNSTLTDFDRWHDTSYPDLVPTDMEAMTEPNPFVEHEIPFTEGHPLYWVPPKDANMKDWAYYKQGITFYEPREI